MDQDLRWELIASLVVGGRAGQEQIDAELEHDNTATGQNAAALAKAAIPTAEAKAAAWESIVVTGELSNALQGSAVAGFTRVLDTALLEPYAEKYFAAVPGIVKDRTHALAQQIVVGPLPGAADHAGNGGPHGRVPGRAAGGQRRAASDDAGKPRRRRPRPARPRGGRLGPAADWLALVDAVRTPGTGTAASRGPAVPRR